MHKEVVFGAPGTGKTTYLMKLLGEKLLTVPAEKIAFVSYTKQGTYEGVSRAIEEFDLKQDQTRYFKTIHSLCFRSLGVSMSMMINKGHYKLLSDRIGMAFTGYYSEDYGSPNDMYIAYLSMMKHNEKLAYKIGKDLNPTTLKYVTQHYNDMKHQLGIYDFDDLLVRYLEHGDPLDVDVAFIDEGQDLTPLQWRVIRKLFSKAKEIYVAGDDDQAVYEWSGAKVSEFLNFSDKHTVLAHSYRLPRNVLDMAKRITGDISRRKDKEFSPRDTDGTITAAPNLKEVGLCGGELVLARTNWILRGMAHTFSSQGIPYTVKGHTSIDRQTLKAIKAHIAFENNEIDIKAMSKFSTFFKKIDFSPWYTTLNLPRSVVTHYTNVIANNNEEVEPVKFETYHSCKGSENDHVVLSSELSARVHKAMFGNYDSELRCLYVGMTRTKKNLTMLIPATKHYYPGKYFRSNDNEARTN